MQNKPQQDRVIAEPNHTLAMRYVDMDEQESEELGFYFFLVHFVCLFCSCICVCGFRNMYMNTHMCASACALMCACIED